MLVLSRKESESFFIGDEIEVVVLEMQGDKVKLGINAPKHVKVLRNELVETKEANIEATTSVQLDLAKKFGEKFKK